MKACCDVPLLFITLMPRFPLDSSQDSSQIELLKELLDLQKDMIVMMLSLLEGSKTLLLSGHGPWFIKNGQIL